MAKKLVVFITRPIPQAGIDLIKKHATVVLRKTDSIIPRAELLQGVRKADILLPILTDKIDAEVMQAAPQLQLIANYGAGYNNVDVTAATQRDIRVTNTPGVLTDTTAELTVALMLTVARRMVESDAIMRAGQYPGWGPMLYMGHGISGKTLGIIGLGRIGSRVAEIAHHGFGMHIVYYTKHKEREVEKSLGAKKVTLQTLLKTADVVTLHVPLLPETHHLIGTKELKLMKNTAIIINTSRGPVIDEVALVKVLRTHEIAGAGLDVYENEPKAAPGLLQLNNAVVLPHIGSATVGTRTAMAMVAAKNIVDFIHHRTLPNCVNPLSVQRSS